MNDTDKKYEAIIAELGLLGPRVTPAMVEEILATVTYDTRVIQDTTTTISAAILPSGFVLATGMSACAARENFNPALGIEMAISKARDAAREALWKFEGYRLSQALYEVRQGCASAALGQIRKVLGVKSEIQGGKPELLPPGPEQVALAGTEGYAPHEVRVIYEKAELDGKIASLGRFLSTEAFWRLPREERERLGAQEGAMKAYAEILEERVKAFRPVAGSQDAGASK